MKNISLTVSRNAQHIGITNPVTCVINNIQVTKDSGLLDKEIQEVLKIATNGREDIYKLPSYQGFKGLFAKLGYPNQVTACDRLIHHYNTKGWKSINNIVDSYNLCSVLYGTPIGLHDFNKITTDVEIKLATGDEEILPMFKKKLERITKGNLIYQTGGITLCWMGKSDIDADRFKVTEETDAVFIMLIGNENTTHAFNQGVCISIYNLIKRSCPLSEISFIETILK